MNMRRATLYTFFYKIFLSLVTFANGALTARYLVDKGDRLNFQFAGTVTNTGTTYVGGFTGYYAYALSKNPERAEQVLQMGNLFVFGISFLLWLGTSLALLLGLSLPMVWVWALYAMPLNFIFGYGTRILQGSNQMSWLNRINAAQPVLFLLLYLPVFLMGRQMPEAWRLMFTFMNWAVTTAVAAGGAMLISYRLLDKRRVYPWHYTREEWLGTFRYGGWLSLANLVNIANYRMDFWMVRAMVPANTASDYGIAVTASEVLLNISGSLTQVVFTRMTGAKREDAIAITELSSRHALLSSGAVAIGMAAFFPWLIVAAYGHRYIHAIWPFLILLPGLVVKAPSNLILQYVTNTLGHPKGTILMNGMSAAINYLICIALLPGFSLMGGAIASTVSYGVSYVVYNLWFAHYNKSPLGNLWRLRKEDFVPYLRVFQSVWQRLG
ncbi:hypothetical protein D2Q93_05295 [Alicyclobacillaceae bacterium I2511]|nr:hypothetical protein D2Q93_05295 [Alicyclobacillaceae bacterium I2511]